MSNNETREKDKERMNTLHSFHTRDLFQSLTRIISAN